MSGDPLRVLFGAPGGAVDRDRLIVRHGRRARLEPLLGNALIRNLRELRLLARTYSQEIEISSFPGGRLQWTPVDGAEYERVGGANRSCYSFAYLDEHFRRVRDFRRALAAVMGAGEENVMCRGWLHTPGAGMPRHCDAVDVLVVQLFGTRWWRLERNSEPPVGIDAPVVIGTRVGDGWDRTFTRRSCVIRMRAGSALFIPRAWWHQTRSDASSFSISTSIRET